MQGSNTTGGQKKYVLDFPNIATHVDRQFAMALWHEKIKLTPYDIMNFTFVEYMICESIDITKIQYQNYLEEDNKMKQTSKNR